jgi:hypothetical protein
MHDGQNIHFAYSPIVKKIILLFFLLVFLANSQSVWEWKKIDPIGNDLNSIAYGNGLFVAVGNSTILSSPDATTWTKRDSSGTIASTLLSVSFGNNRFLAYDGNNVFTSLDGTTWIDYPKEDRFGRMITYANDLFFSVGYPALIVSSPDGTRWITRSYSDYPQENRAYASLAFGNGQFVAVGNKGENCGLISVSPDGTTWNSVMESCWDFLSRKALISVAYGKGLFVALSDSMILFSSDGSTWIAQKSTEFISLASLAFGNNQFVAVGDNGMILASHDAITWTRKNSGCSVGLSFVTYGNGRFVAVGSGGTILTSKADSAIENSVKICLKGAINSLKIKFSNTVVSTTLPHQILGNEFNVGIFTIAGKKIYSSAIKRGNGIITISVKGFPGGKYFFSFKDENNRTLNSSFVLTR